MTRPATAVHTMALICAVSLALAHASATVGDRAAAAPVSSVASRPLRPPAAISPKDFCAKLQPVIQPLVKLPLVLYKADDATTDSDHASESQYVDCDFRQQGTQVDVSLHDDSDHDLFDDPTAHGYTSLAGFGDKARSASAMGEHWVDVVRGSLACEARLMMADDSQINGDWKQAAGKMCEAAFAAR